MKEFNVHTFVLHTISKIGDTTHVRIGLPIPPIDGWDPENATAVHPGIRKLVNNLPSFYLYPISPDASDHASLTAEQIQRFKLGAKGRKQSFFLHAMRLRAHAVFEAMSAADTYYPSIGKRMHRPFIGENFQHIAMNWAWKEVVDRRKEMTEWRRVEWRDWVFKPTALIMSPKT